MPQIYNEVQSTPHRVVIIGGSTVYGEGDPAGGGFVGRFRAKFETLHERNRVFNLGIGGDTVAMIRKRAVSEVQARRAELIICYPGLNDIKRVGSAKSPHSCLITFQREFKSLLEELVFIAPTIVMTAVPIDELRTQPFREDMFFLETDAEEITGLVKGIASNLEVPVFDIFTNWINRPNRRDLLADGLHCNEQGHSLLADELMFFLSQRLI